MEKTAQWSFLNTLLLLLLLLFIIVSSNIPGLITVATSHLRSSALKYCYPITNITIILTIINNYLIISIQEHNIIFYEVLAT